MDEKWFKAQQRKAGVTAEDIAQRLGRSRTGVSNILNGRQRMTLDWAKAFAEALDVPLAEVLERAGVTDAETAHQLQPGFSDNDAAPWRSGPDDRQSTDIAQLFGARPGVDVWRVRNDSMSLAGYIPGDYILVDTHRAERAKAGDVVLAQVYDYRRGTAMSVLRRFAPPFIVPQSPSIAVIPVHVVDGNNVVIRGVVTASWRY